MKYIVILVIGVVLMGVTTRQHLPRGIRNNNPGNIRKNNIEWVGAKPFQTDSEFVQFISPTYGIRAMAKILFSYQRRGLSSITDIISTYAPSTENKTDNYIRFVSERLQVDPNLPLDLNSKLFELIQAIIIFENGTLYADHYDDNTLQAGIALA